MKDIISKAIAKNLSEPIGIIRENSVFHESGRIFLDAAALGYGAAVNSDGEIIGMDGKKIEEGSETFKNIVETAKKQARAQSSLGSDLLGS